MEDREYAKHLSEVFKAYSEGKTIQYEYFDKISKSYKWQDITEFNKMYFSYGKYRIKPGPKYRPYKNAEEFLKAHKEHGPFIKSDVNTSCAYYSIRVVHPMSEGITFSYALGAGDREINYQQLFNEMYWQDGTPCGIQE